MPYAVGPYEPISELDPRGGVGGGGTSSQRLEPSGESRERGESMRGGLTPRSLEGGSGDLPRNISKKIYVSENAFQAILKPIFPYSITSILSKARHSNTLFLTIILHIIVVLLVLFFLSYWLRSHLSISPGSTNFEILIK